MKAADVIERVHTELDSGEKDFFSLFFFRRFDLSLQMLLEEH